MLSLVGQYKTRAHFEGKLKQRTDISHANKRSEE